MSFCEIFGGTPVFLQSCQLVLPADSPAASPAVFLEVVSNAKHAEEVSRCADDANGRADERNGNVYKVDGWLASM